MDVALSIFGAVAAASVGIGGLWIWHRELADGESRRILRDIEILNALLADSATRTLIADAIESSIRQTLLNRHTKRRNPANIGIGLFFLAASEV